MELNEPPSRLSGRYRFESGIGTGGFGAVFAAWDTQLERTVAVKRLSIDHMDGEGRQRAWQEAMRLAALKHPNIVTIYDFGEDDHGAYVVMEFVQGETLEQIIERAPLPLEDFLRLAEQVLDGLISAHYAGMVHRDLKPRNIMLTWLASGTFQAKILDFGLSKFTQASRSHTVTEAGELFGSIHIMSPEQFRKEPFDCRSDLYAVGCTMFYALTGRMPFEGESVADIIASHLQHQHLDLKTLRPDLPEPLFDWVEKLFALDPGDRFATGQQALAALRNITVPPVAVPRLETQTVREVPVNVPVAESGRKGNRRLVAAFAACTLLGAGAWYFLSEVQSARHAKALEPVAEVDHSPVMAEKAPSAPTANITSSRPSALDRIYRPTDLDDLGKMIDQKVTIEGVPMDVGKNKTETIRYLNFDKDYRSSVALVFFVEADPVALATRLAGFLGKKVRVTGQLEEYRGSLQIVLKSPDEVRLVE